MKKFTFIAVLFFCAMNMNAQSFDFVHEGKVLENGATISVTDTIVTSITEYKGQIYTSYQVDAEVFIKNNGAEEGTASLTIAVKEGEEISFCGFGTNTCMMVSVGRPVTRENILAGGEEVDPHVYAKNGTVIDGGEFTPFTYKSVVEYTLTYGSTTKTVTVNFDYDSANSINSLNTNSNISLVGNELTYNFDNAATRQLNVYNVTGSLVKSEALETSGTVVLNNMNKGVYIYEVIENGKRIAAHKCVIR